MVVRLGLAMLLASALVAPAAAAELALSGSVTYRERIALPPDPVLHVRLVDAANLQAPAVIEARAAVATPGEVPLAFTLRFDDSLLDAGRSYAITAEITSAGALWFASFSPSPVDPTVGTVAEPIILNFAGRVADPGAPPPPEPPAPAEAGLLNVVWQAAAIAGEALPPSLEATLSIGSDLRAGGRGGCNSYFAQTWVEGEQLQFSAITATEMACSDAAVTQLEASYFEALRAARFWRQGGDGLLLLGQTGDELVRFRRSSR